MTPEDDDRTIVRPASGRGRDTAALGHMLPVGTRLREYEITGLIGEGGFGIVYLADDVSLQRRVAIKEYMPSSMASRVGNSATIVVKSERHRETFAAGLKSFVNEARLLARFDHPALVKVYRFWEENGTAYMAMPYYEGPTLKSALAARRDPPDEAALRQLLRPLLDALSVMHTAQCYHRDIAPDNILLTAAGPLLLDFGAARRVIGDMTHALTVVLKPGYAPIEQYGDVATMSQGAWTDLYALACVLYFAITGKVPMSSVERLMDDRLEPLSRVAAGRYGPRFLQAIDAALAVRPQDRPQTEAAFRALLDEPATQPVPGFPASLEADMPTRIVPRTHLPTGTHSPTFRPGPVTGAPPPPVAQPPRQRPEEESTVIGPAMRARPPVAPAAAPARAQPVPSPAPGAFDTPRTTRPPVPIQLPGAGPRGPDSRAAALDSRPAPLDVPRPAVERHATSARPARPPAMGPTAQPQTRAEEAPAAIPIARAVPQPATRPSRAPLFIAGGVAAIAIAIVGVVQFRPQHAPESGASRNATDVAPATRSTTAPSTAPLPSVDRPAPSATATLPASTAPNASQAAGSSSSDTTATLVVPPPVAPTATPPVEVPAKRAATAKPDARNDTPRPATRNEGPRYEATRPETARPETARAETPHTEAPVVKPARTPNVQAKCSDILQKASLEQLTAEENAFLRRECR